MNDLYPMHMKITIQIQITRPIKCTHEDISKDQNVIMATEFNCNYSQTKLVLAILQIFNTGIFRNGNLMRVLEIFKKETCLCHFSRSQLKISFNLRTISRNYNFYNLIEKKKKRLCFLGNISAQNKQASSSSVEVLFEEIEEISNLKFIRSFIHSLLFLIQLFVMVNSFY